MIDFARFSVQDRLAYIQETASRRGLVPIIVEKDFWVCFILKMLFDLPQFYGAFVFKGGTSLSKVFGIIKRFSEDIDVSVSPEYLGFSAAQLSDATASRSQFEKRCKALEKECSAFIEQTLFSALDAAITGAIGPLESGSRRLEYMLDAQTHSPVVTFTYPDSGTQKSEYFKPSIKLEFGSLTDQQPTRSHPVKPWVAEEFPEIIKNPACAVIALEAERTFWEKATILHKEFHRPAASPMRTRFSRDCYDVFCLAQHDAGKRAMADTGMLERVVKFKKAFFNSSWANYDTAAKGSLKLVPPPDRIAEIKADYAQMRPMFFEEPPEFGELMDTLARVENEINRKDGKMPAKAPLLNPC